MVNKEDLKAKLNGLIIKTAETFEEIKDSDTYRMISEIELSTDNNYYKEFAKTARELNENIMYASALSKNGCLNNKYQSISETIINNLYELEKIKKNIDWR